MVFFKFIKNLKSVLFYQNWIIIFFRITKLHKILGRALFIISKYNYRSKINFLDSDMSYINFTSLSEYHKNNYIDANDRWYLNNICHGPDLFLSVKNKNDYTRELVFSYLEWLFSSINVANKKKLKDLINKSLSSDYSKEPSSASLRIYPLIFAFQNNVIDKFFLENELKECYAILHKKIELDTGANHLIDNFISLSILSSFFHKNYFLKLYISFLKISLNHATPSGYYEEKNPTYAIGLSLRLKILIDILSVKSNISNEFIDCIKDLSDSLNKLKNCPIAPINDSYLKFSSLEKFYELDNQIKIVKDYFVLKKYGNNAASLILNSVGKRGYLGHSHDASMSLFIYNFEHKKFLICNFGTPSYANIEKRHSSRRANMYPNILKKARKIKSIGSFRIYDIFVPKIIRNEDNQFYDSKTKIQFSINYSSIKIESNEKQNIFSFFSDFSDLDLQTSYQQISFKNVYKIKKKSAFRYDGIYNKINCYKYDLFFRHEMEILILND